MRGNQVQATAADGTIYVVSGGAGATLYDNDTQFFTAKSQKVHSAVNLVIRRGHLEMEAFDDAGSPVDSLVIDPVRPPSSDALHAAIIDAWPRLSQRIRWFETPLDAVTLDAADVIVSSHACGALTDRVLDAALAAGAPVAVLPCCHDDQTCDAGPLGGWMDLALAVDSLRAVRLADRGYDVWTQEIPPEITPKHRLLVGRPRRQSAGVTAESGAE